MLDDINDHEWKLTDIVAKLTRLVQYGEVAEVDGNRVRVTLPGQNKASSAWLRTGTRRAKGVSQVSRYEPGEQVVCLFPPFGGGRFGVVLCSVHNAKDAPWTEDENVEGVKYADGTTFSYNMATGRVDLSLTDGRVAIHGEPGTGWVISGPCEFQDEVTHKKAVTCESTLSAVGNISTQAELSDATGTVSSIRVTYNGHTHNVPDGVSDAPNQSMRKQPARKRARKAR